MGDGRQTAAIADPPPISPPLASGVLVSGSASSQVSASSGADGSLRGWNRSRWWPWAGERYLEHVLGRVYWRQFDREHFDLATRLAQALELTALQDGQDENAPEAGQQAGEQEELAPSDLPGATRLREGLAWLQYAERKLTSRHELARTETPVDEAADRALLALVRSIEGYIDRTLQEGELPESDPPELDPAELGAPGEEASTEDIAAGRQGELPLDPVAGDANVGAGGLDEAMERDATAYWLGIAGSVDQRRARHATARGRRRS